VALIIVNFSLGVRSRRSFLGLRFGGSRPGRPGIRLCRTGRRPNGWGRFWGGLSPPPRSGVAVELGADEVEAAVDTDHAGFEFKEVELGCDFGSPEEGIAVHIVEFVIGTGECGEDEIVASGDEARPFDPPAASFDFDSDITRAVMFEGRGSDDDGLDLVVFFVLVGVAILGACRKARKRRG
jgi:hypothetical protein